MRVLSVIGVTAVVAGVLLCPPCVDEASAQDYELRTWTVSAAAAGDPIASSDSYEIRSRLGGSFVGHSLSYSYVLWGCGIFSPVQGAFYAVATDDECIRLRWTVESLSDIAGFHIRRSRSDAGPFERINEEMIPAQNPGTYEDRTVWPQVEFCYELWAVTHHDGEVRIDAAPACAMANGSLVTRLHPLCPSPFREATTIRFEVARAQNGVVLTIYDVAGRIVTELVRGTVAPGRYEMQWDGKNESGVAVSSGVYFCRLEASDVRETQSVLVLR